MIFEYQNKTATIVATPTGVRDGFYTLSVSTSYNGEESAWKESVPVQTLRNRAAANGTDIQTERDAFTQEALNRAQERFKDTVDLEVL